MTPFFAVVCWIWYSSTCWPWYAHCPRSSSRTDRTCSWHWWACPRNDGAQRTSCSCSPNLIWSWYSPSWSHSSTWYASWLPSWSRYDPTPWYAPRHGASTRIQTHGAAWWHCSTSRIPPTSWHASRCTPSRIPSRFCSWPSSSRVIWPSVVV
jgi:hypothetical protein